MSYEFKQFADISDKCTASISGIKEYAKQTVYLLAFRLLLQQPTPSIYFCLLRAAPPEFSSL
jgi:hypothetical protein